MEYVRRIDSLLDATLCREVRADEDKTCRHCTNNYNAIWRCKDCSMGIPMCRGCLRRDHKSNPFHRIEQWNGHFFQHADLWEVGTYLLIRHHNAEPICERLHAQETFLETIEQQKDVAEQEKLKSSPGQQTYTAHPSSATVTENDDIRPTVEAEEDNLRDDIEGDEEFLRYIQELKDGEDEDSPGADENFREVEDDVEDDEIDDPTMKQYLPHKLNVESMAESIANLGTNSAQHIMGSYVRVVHTNGIHNIAMVSCECRGHDTFPKDLLAARLLPASFDRIRTLFSTHLLDYFRLCNLELKSSAYHFYHLLQRLTNPMDPSSVVDLYREFRRMSRVWRWMKRLKWAGYGNKDKDASDTRAGQLTIFCPACPQPGINLADNWKEDPARSVYDVYYCHINSLMICRWVYKRIFVADGNFKADHVRQKTRDGDVWLAEGAGMIPKREEYHSFLETAIERLTVCIQIMAEF